MKNKIINNYKYYLFCKSALWIGPILTLFYLLNNLSYTEIFIIASFYKIAVAFFEVPTGAFADKFGHKKSVLLGLLIVTLCIILYPLGSTFWYYILIETLLAVGATLISGADESLFYDTLKSEGLESDYTKYKGRAKQYSFLSQLIGSLVAAYLFVISPELPFFVSGIVIFIGLLIFSTFKEVSNSDDVNKNISYFKQIKETGVYIFKHKKIKTIIIYASLIHMTYMSLVHTYTPYFLSVGIDEKYFGIIFALFNIVALLSSRYNDFYIKMTKPNSLIFLGIILFLSYIVLGLVTIPIGIIGICIQQIYRGINDTTIRKYINKCSPAEKRATILSYLSLVITLVGGLFGVFLGIILDYTDINTTYLILASITLIITVIMYFFLKKNLTK